MYTKGTTMKIFDNAACAACDILIPAESADLTKWAVVACDQFTSDRDYWDDVYNIVGDAPSTAKLILPETYLEDDDKEARLASIRENADKYLSDGTFTTLPDSFVLVDRSTPVTPSRKGLVLALDLEEYNFDPAVKSRCKATEGTVISRIPPRIKIRSNCPIELPHVMLLIDDPKDTVIGSAFAKAEEEGLEVIYDTPLMKDSGSIKGIRVPADSATGKLITDGLAALCEGPEDILYLVGDGNHSLASAKAHWDNVKEGLSEEERKTHPARFALTEVVNIHDKGLAFEPIHRIVFGISSEDLIAKASEYFGCDGSDGEVSFVVTDGACDKEFKIPNPPHSLAVGCLGLFLDDLCNKDDSIKVDYIHGEDEVRSLSSDKAAGVFLPGISKDTFFDTVRKEGVFPRKTFSMGHAFEKRFYMEARKIVR